LSVQKNACLFLKIATVYIGSVIGAGFASGQEIMQFFVLKGKGGLYGSVLVTLLFAYLGGLVVYLSAKYSTRNYKELIFHLLGPKFVVLFDLLSLVALFGGLSVMMSGSAAIFQEHLGLSPPLGALSVAAGSVFVILGGLSRFLQINLFLAPLKLAAVVAVAVAGILFYSDGPAFPPSLPDGKGVAGHWAMAGVLYVSYNMIGPFAVLSSLGAHVPAKTGVAAGVAGGLLIGLAVFLVALAGMIFYPEVADHEVPMLILAGFHGVFVKWFLGLMIWVAMLTTAIGNVHGLASRLSPAGGKQYVVRGTLVCLLALLPAAVSFSVLVRFLYPLFGYVGLLLLVSLLFGPLVKRRR